MHHVRTFFSEWRYDFFVLFDVHSQHVDHQEESLPGVLLLKKDRCKFVLIIFYLQVINSGHAASSMAEENQGTDEGKFSS